MGMSASQSRMLSLTTRLSDLEFSAQSISNSKIRLADSSAEASKAYQDALDKQKITVLNSNTATYVDANAYNLTTYNAISTLDKQRFLATSSGQIVVSSNVKNAFDSSNSNSNAFLSSMGVVTNTAAANYDAAAVIYYQNVFSQMSQNGSYAPGDDKMKDSEWLYTQLSIGNLTLVEQTQQDANGDGSNDWSNISWSSGDASLQTVSDDREIAKAEAEYETVMAEIESKDSRYDMELKTIDTEHSAVQTEIDSVKKVIDKNIERTFKIFDA